MVAEEIRRALDRIPVPGAGRSLVKLGFVRDIEIGEDRVKIILASLALNRKWMDEKVKDALKDIAKEVEVYFIEATPVDLTNIRSRIAVMSGKGGVGKSVVTSLLATALNRKGYDVGILDADLTGASIPKMFGVSWKPIVGPNWILPAVTGSGIEIMSINLFLPHEEDALIWRAPLIGKTIQQLYRDVIWGELDFLMIDLPPGTSDAPITIAQTLRLSGIIIVSSPQELAGMVVRKAINFSHNFNIPILGVVENMSYFVIPETGKKIEIFGRSRGEEIAEAAQAPFLGQIPLDPQLSRLCDEGLIESYNSDTFESLANNFTKMVSGLMPK